MALIQLYLSRMLKGLAIRRIQGLHQQIYTPHHRVTITIIFQDGAAKENCEGDRASYGGAVSDYSIDFYFGGGLTVYH